MTSRSAAVAQLKLPFPALLDRVRTASETGEVYFGPDAIAQMDQYDMTDKQVIHSLANIASVDQVKAGDAKGEWRCVIRFQFRGSRAGGVLSLTIGEGKIYILAVTRDKKND